MTNPTDFNQYTNYEQISRQPYSGYYPQSNKTNVLAILAVVFIISPVALVLGHIALYQIKRSGEKGRGMALTALIITYVFYSFFILLFIVGIIGLGDIMTA